MATPKLFPSPDDKQRWALWRDQKVLELYPKFAAQLGLGFEVYQRYFMIPPKPYRFQDMQLLMMAGAKRIGKSMFGGFAPLPYVLCPGAEIRLYAPMHELATREFGWIKKFLFGPLAEGEPLVERAPDLKHQLIDFNDNPSEGELLMKWSWGTVIRSKSQVPNDDDWVGEPVDLGIICEPGKFNDLDHSFTDVIKPNLEDRNGLVRCVGTVDELGMKDLHEKCHDHDANPNNFCVCEIPRWANRSLFRGYSKEQLRARILQERRDSTWKAFSINWLGLWSVHAKTALEQWDKDIHVRKIRPEAYAKLLEGPPMGWVEFIGMDTGSFKAAGHYYASPDGYVLRIQEFVNYERRGSVEEVTDSRGMSAFMAQIRAGVGARPMNVFGDRTSQFKQDVEARGDFFWDPDDQVVNDHGVGVDNFNEYLSQKKFMIVRPYGSAPTMLEVEIPRLRWKEGAFGPGAKPMLDGATRGHAVDEARYALSSHPISPIKISTDRPENWVQRDMRKILARAAQMNEDVMFDEMPGMGGW